MRSKAPSGSWRAWAVRLAWFVALWVMGVAALGLLALVLRRVLL